MPCVRGFVSRPQSTVLRTAAFQVHLWAGIALALYVVVVSVTGAALMFRPQMQAATWPGFFEIERRGPDASTSAILSAFETAYPDATLVGIDYPTARRGSVLAYLVAADGSLITAFAHPETGAMLGELPADSWVSWLQQLHFNLLGGSTGLLVNGLGALGLALLCLTGPLVWWPGPRRWRAALGVDPRRGWKRITWELHGAVGAWSLVFLLMWAITGVEFAFPAPFRATVAGILPTATTSTPVSSAQAGATAPPPIPVLVERAQLAAPGAKLGRLVTPTAGTAPLQILMAYEDHGDADRSDEVTVYFDRHTGELLDRREGSDVPAGDATLAWMGRLHTGAFGGPTITVAWFLLGLAPPLMAVTGLVMWWNRVVRRRVEARGGTA
jgi:uncharacterized iron-regulated membrane protein